VSWESNPWPSTNGQGALPPSYDYFVVIWFKLFYLSCYHIFFVKSPPFPSRQTRETLSPHRSVLFNSSSFQIMLHYQWFQQSPKMKNFQLFTSLQHVNSLLPWKQTLPFHHHLHPWSLSKPFHRYMLTLKTLLLMIQLRIVTILSSHLNPTCLASSDPLSASLCSAGSNSDDNQNCVFCNIIRGQSPALKVFFSLFLNYSFVVKIYFFAIIRRFWNKEWCFFFKLKWL